MPVTLPSTDGTKEATSSTAPGSLAAGVPGVSPSSTVVTVPVEAGAVWKLQDCVASTAPSWETTPLAVIVTSLSGGSAASGVKVSFFASPDRTAAPGTVVPPTFAVRLQPPAIGLLKEIVGLAETAT